MAITFKEFEKLVQGWLNERWMYFERLWPLRGGWELWAQADLAAYIFKKDSTIDLLREQHIYNAPRKKVDWLVNYNNLDVSKKIAVELKCFSLDNGGNFFQSIIDDFHKMALANISAAYTLSQRYIMTIYPSDRALLDWIVAENFTQIFLSTVPGNQNIGCAWLKIP